MGELVAYTNRKKLQDLEVLVYLTIISKRTLWCALINFKSVSFNSRMFEYGYSKPVHRGLLYYRRVIKKRKTKITEITPNIIFATCKSGAGSSTLVTIHLNSTYTTPKIAIAMINPMILSNMLIIHKLLRPLFFCRSNISCTNKVAGISS